MKLTCNGGSQMYYVYAHIDSEGAVRYVGKGHGRRAWQNQQRNKHWRSIFDKTPPVIKFLCLGLKEKEAFDHEIAYIDHYRGQGCKLCNLTDGGEGVSGIKLGPMTDEHKAKIGAAHIGKPRSDKTKRLLSIANTGKKPSNETRAKMSIANFGRVPWNTGKKLSEDHKRKISDSEKGEKNPFYGKKHSKETKQKQAKAKMGNKYNLGRKHSDESKARMSAGMRGRQAHNKGVPMTEKQKIKLFEGFRHYCANKRKEA